MKNNCLNGNLKCINENRNGGPQTLNKPRVEAAEFTMPAKPL